MFAKNSGQTKAAGIGHTRTSAPANLSKPARTPKCLFVFFTTNHFLLFSFLVSVDTVPHKDDIPDREPCPEGICNEAKGSAGTRLDEAILHTLISTCCLPRYSSVVYYWQGTGLNFGY